MASAGGTIAIAIISSGGLSALVSWALNKRTAEGLETLKANLTQGHSLARAQYDLELESFRDLWSAMHCLGTAARSIAGLSQLKVVTSEGESEGWRKSALSGATRNFSAAHNNAVRAVHQHAPFYPAEIRDMAQATFTIDMDIIAHLSKIDAEYASHEWFDEIAKLSHTLNSQINCVETEIRTRLADLRRVT